MDPSALAPLVMIMVVHDWLLEDNNRREKTKRVEKMHRLMA